jgi:hypothetical protein
MLYFLTGEKKGNNIKLSRNLISIAVICSLALRSARLDLRMNPSTNPAQKVFKFGIGIYKAVKGQPCFKTSNIFPIMYISGMQTISIQNPYRRLA